MFLDALTSLFQPTLESTMATVEVSCSAFRRDFSFGRGRQREAEIDKAISMKRQDAVMLGEMAKMCVNSGWGSKLITKGVLKKSKRSLKSTPS